MKTKMLSSTLLAASLAALALLVSPSASHAQLQFVLQPSTQIGAPGSLLTYSGTLTNLGGSELFLNGDDFTLAGSGLTLNDTPFFSNFPLSLLGGQSYTDALFTVAIGPSVPGGNYNGSFTIQGGANDNTFSNLATQTFTVSVPSPAAPEPASGLLLVCGGGIAALGIVKRRKAAK